MKQCRLWKRSDWQEWNSCSSSAGLFHHGTRILDVRFGNSSKKFRATADGRLFVELHRSAGGSDDSQTVGELSPVAWRRVLVCTANSWTVCLSGLQGGAADGEVFALQIICMRSELGPLSQGGVGGSSLLRFELENLCKKKKKEICEKTCKETLLEERILP